MLARVKSQTGFTPTPKLTLDRGENFFITSWPFKFNRVTRNVGVISSSERGFTIIEVVITIAAFAVLMLVVLNLFDWQNGNYQQQLGIIRSTAANRRAIQEIEPLLISARRILASQTINGTLYTTDNNTVVVQLPAYDSSNNTIVNTWDYAAINLNGTELWKDIQADSASERESKTERITDLVSSFTITYGNADLALARWAAVNVQTQLVVRQLTFRSKIEQQFSLRNYY